jgi:outer membrane protein OmpA-like peptidoglycan-associated protein
MVTVAADAMNKEMNANGSVAIYGILFDFDKADIKPESKPQLDEIAKLLKANPKLHVLIVGHTDNKGQLGYNQTLSSKRAAAVVAKIAKDYGVPAAQMTAVGVGPAAPVATNDTDAGQAKNRRVELVKM